MKPYVVKTPQFVQRLYPKRLWSFPRDNKKVFLTFDDGPIPKVTTWVLDQLISFDAKATFFCIGDNVKKHPDIFRRIISEGHTVGNHTYNHLKGTKTKTTVYLENVLKAQEEIERFGVESLKLKVGSWERSSVDRDVQRKSLFRPPYGKITKRQAEALQNKGYKIVMWDVLSADFDTTISEEICLENVLGALAPGSIVVFHDSLKASKNLMYTLPKVLKFISEKGWKCEAIQS